MGGLGIEPVSVDLKLSHLVMLSTLPTVPLSQYMHQG